MRLIRVTQVISNLSFFALWNKHVLVQYWLQVLLPYLATSLRSFWNCSPFTSGSDPFMKRIPWIPTLVFLCILVMLYLERRHLVPNTLMRMTTTDFQQFNSTDLRASNYGSNNPSNVLETINHSSPESFIQTPCPVSKNHLKSEFERSGSILSSVETSNLTYSSSCVLVAATSTGYRYSKAWASNRRAEGIPFVLFEVKNVRMGELAAHYARIPALLATARSLPRARYLVYTDVDTLVDFDIACTRVREHPGKALSITYKIEKRRRVIRTNWFVIHAWHRRAQHLLLTWLYSGRQVYLQDQTVLNELYARKQWIRDNILPVPLNDDFGRAEIRHCGSYLRARDKCIRSLKMHIYRPNKKFLLGAM